VTRTRRLPVLVAGLVSFGLSLTAQNVPRRPDINGADTNQAAAYYSYGLSMLEQDPRKAQDAFYWAARIDPNWAKPLYAQRIAFLVGADDQFVIGYMDGKRSFTRSKEAQRIDSLELRARMLDPFMERELDKDLMLRYVRALYDEAQKADGGTDDRAQTLRPEAQQHLHRAVELDPYFANPYYVLGRVDEFAGKPADAAGDYRAHLGHARAQDPRIAEVQRRLAELTGAAANQ
jgi:hypothetical protein